MNKEKLEDLKSQISEIRKAELEVFLQKFEELKKEYNCTVVFEEIYRNGQVAGTGFVAVPL